MIAVWPLRSAGRGNEKEGDRLPTTGVAADPAADPALRMGGVALSNGLVVVSRRHWAAAIREADGTISVASGRKPLLPGTGESADDERPSADEDGADSQDAGDRRAYDGIPVIRGLGRFAESLLVLGLVRKQLPGARLPFESRKVAGALMASMAGATAVKVMAPRSALAQEAGTALAAFVPAVLSVKNSAVSGYHGAEHKVIGAREEALRAASGGSDTDAAEGGSVPGSTDLTGDAATAPKEHDRCGSNLVGPFLLASVITNVLARDRRGRKTPLRSAAAGAASLGLALEGMRWIEKHADSVVARVLMLPGRAIQKGLTTSEPTPEQLEVGERALAELLRLEGMAD